MIVETEALWETKIRTVVKRTKERSPRKRNRKGKGSVNRVNVIVESGGFQVRQNNAR